MTEQLEEACWFGVDGVSHVKRLRDTMTECRSALGAQHFPGLVSGYFAFYCGTAPEKAELVEQELLKEHQRVERQALQRFRVGHDSAARALLTSYVEERLLDALNLGEDLVRVRVELDNHGVRDHRLRAWFPLPQPASTSHAECAFGSVERGLHDEGGPTEKSLATFPSRRWVQAGGQTLVAPVPLRTNITSSYM